MSSLTFDFPGFQKQFSTQDSTKHGSEGAGEGSGDARESWKDDLEELSGDEGLEEGGWQKQDPSSDAARQQQAANKQQRTAPSTAAGCSREGSQCMPDAVLLMVADQLCLRDAMALACCCRAFHESLLEGNSSSGALWQQQERELLGSGWPWAPFKGAKPLLLPPSLGTSPLLHLKTTLGTSKVALQYFVMRKGYEFMLAGFEALWGALEHTAPPAGPAAAAAAAAAPAASATALSPPAGASHTAPSSPPLPPAAAGGFAPGPLAGSSCVTPTAEAAVSAASHPAQQHQQPQPQPQQQPQQQQAAAAAPGGGRALQRLVDKLALHSWELTYSGYSAALAARCDELAHTLRTAWKQQQQQQQQASPASMVAAGDVPEAPAAVAAGDSATAGCSSSGAAQAAAAGAIGAAAAAAAAVLPAAVLADCAGGILRDIESVSGGLGAGELLAGEPELLLAATRRGPRPGAAIALWSRLLPVWERYRRWLDLVTARCGLLGARVAAARQLAEPSARGPPNAALLPHLRNKGLLLFRGHVLLAYGLRRPLQEAALWLAAAASADAPAWRSGGGCSEADLELLLRVRKLLTELDVADGQDEEAGQHTHAKFRRCFGALLTRQRRSRCLPASAW